MSVSLVSTGIQYPSSAGTQKAPADYRLASSVVGGTGASSYLMSGIPQYARDIYFVYAYTVTNGPNSQYLFASENTGGLYYTAGTPPLGTNDNVYAGFTAGITSGYPTTGTTASGTTANMIDFTGYIVSYYGEVQITKVIDGSGSTPNKYWYSTVGTASYYAQTRHRMGFLNQYTTSTSSQLYYINKLYFSVTNLATGTFSGWLYYR